MNPRTRRRVGWAAILIAALSLAVAMCGSPAASGQQTNPSAPDAGFSLQSTASADTASDWTDAIPSVYFQRIPVQWSAKTWIDGTVHTPTVLRITRGTTNFAYFSTPDNQSWAMSEDDGTVWHIENYYDNTSWTLASALDIIRILNWIWEILVSLANHIIWFAIGIAIGVALIHWYYGGGGGRGRPDQRNQVDLGMYAGNLEGLQYRLDIDPGTRRDVAQYPAVSNALIQVGVTLP